MTDFTSPDAYGVLTEPTTLRIQRLLPGPIERVWSYLTDSDLRRLWLAAGKMELKVGAPFELVWRHDELTTPPGRRPPGFDDDEHRMQSRVTAVEPPYKLSFTWGDNGEVSFELEPKGDKVLLAIVHRRLRDRPAMLMVSSGWHAHLDVLVARVSGSEPAPFWDVWTRLKQEYEQRLPV